MLPATVLSYMTPEAPRFLATHHAASGWSAGAQAILPHSKSHWSLLLWGLCSAPSGRTSWKPVRREAGCRGRLVYTPTRAYTPGTRLCWNLSSDIPLPVNHPDACSWVPLTHLKLKPPTVLCSGCTSRCLPLQGHCRPSEPFPSHWGAPGSLDLHCPSFSLKVMVPPPESPPRAEDQAVCCFHELLSFRAPITLHPPCMLY